MKKHPFGKTGLSVSRLGFGAAPIGYLKTDQERVGQILNLMLDAGINLIDTAASYPGSEAAIARTVGHRRGEFMLVSKCGSQLDDVNGDPWSAALIAHTVDRSLRHLKTDHLDVMLLHSCNLETLERGEALGALVAARQAGKIRFAGYSGDNEAAAYAATLPEIAVIETSVNVVDQHNIDKVLPSAKGAKIGVLAKRPIANAAWKAISQQPGLYASYAKVYHDRLNELKLTPGDLGFPGTPDKAWPELALRFTLSHAGVDTAIIGTTNPANAQANIAAAEKGPLPADVVNKIRAAFRAADSEGKWTGQT